MALLDTPGTQRDDFPPLPTWWQDAWATAPATIIACGLWVLLFGGFVGLLVLIWFLRPAPAC